MARKNPEAAKTAHPIARAIARRYKLEGGSFHPHLVFELLHETAEELEVLSNIVFEDEAVTLRTLQRLKKSALMLQDAVYLAALCPTEAVDPSLSDADLADLMDDDDLPGRIHGAY